MVSSLTSKELASGCGRRSRARGPGATITFRYMVDHLPGAARTARRARSCALRARAAAQAAAKREPVWTSVRGIAVKAVQPCEAGAEHTRTLLV